MIKIRPFLAAAATALIFCLPAHAVSIDFEPANGYAAGDLAGQPEAGIPWLLTNGSGNPVNVVPGAGANGTQGIVGTGTGAGSNFVYYGYDGVPGPGFDPASSVLYYSFQWRAAAPLDGPVGAEIFRYVVGSNSNTGGAGAVTLTIRGNGRLIASNGSSLEPVDGLFTANTYSTISGTIDYAAKTYTVFVNGVQQFAASNSGRLAFVNANSDNAFIRIGNLNGGNLESHRSWNADNFSLLQQPAASQTERRIDFETRSGYSLGDLNGQPLSGAGEKWALTNGGVNLINVVSGVGTDGGNAIAGTATGAGSNFVYYGYNTNFETGFNPASSVLHYSFQWRPTQPLNGAASDDIFRYVVGSGVNTGTGGAVHLTIRANGRLIAVAGGSNQAVEGLFTLNEYSRISGTIDYGAKTYTLFVNGVQLFTGNNAGNLPFNIATSDNAFIRIGNLNGGNLDRHRGWNADNFSLVQQAPPVATARLIDFETDSGYSLGALTGQPAHSPTGERWMLTNGNSNLVQVVSGAGSNGGNAITGTATGGGSNFVYFGYNTNFGTDFDPSASTVNYSLQWRPTQELAPESGSHIFRFVIGSSGNTGGNGALDLAFSNSGRLIARDGATDRELDGLFTLNEYATISGTIDYAAKTYTLFVDGVQGFTWANSGNLAFTNAAADNAYIRIGNLTGGDLVNYRSWNVDNISLGLASDTPAGGFAEWQFENFSEAELADATISGPLATPAGDGVANLLKYAFGLPAKTPISSADLPRPVMVAGKLQLTYPARIGAEDIDYLPEASSGLVSWSSDNVVEIGRVTEGDWELRTVEATFPADAQRAFLRVRVQPQ